MSLAEAGHLPTVVVTAVLLGRVGLRDATLTLEDTGWNSLSLMSSVMPVPLSRTRASTESPLSRIVTLSAKLLCTPRRLSE